MPGHAWRHFAVSCAKLAEPNKMPIRLWTWVDARKHVLHGDPHWRRLPNTIEPSMFGGPAKTAEPIDMPCGV